MKRRPLRSIRNALPAFCSLALSVPLWSQPVPPSDRLVIDLNPTRESIPLTVFGTHEALGDGRLLFSMQSPDNRRQFWISDGTALGTHALNAVRYQSGFATNGTHIAWSTDEGIWIQRLDGSQLRLLPFGRVALVREVFLTDQLVYARIFSISPKNSQIIDVIWAFDLDDATSHYLGTTNATPGASATWNGLLFLDSDQGVMRTDGTPTGTFDVFSREGTNADFQFVTFHPINDYLLFFFEDGTLYATDGTKDGTRLLLASAPRPDVVATARSQDGSGLYFVRDVISPQASCQLWRSGGTAVSTRRLFDLPRSPSTAHPCPFDLLESGGQLYYILEQEDGEPVQELWGSDLATGQSAPFHPELELHFADGETIRPPVRFGNGLLLNAQEGNQGLLYYANGLQTALLATFDRIGSPEPFGGLALFSIVDNGSNELWTTDGTTSGTRRLIEDPTGAVSLSSNPGSLRRNGDLVGFLAQDAEGAWQSYVTRGDSASALALTDFSSAESSTSTETLLPLADGFLSRVENDAGESLWYASLTSSPVRLFEGRTAIHSALGATERTFVTVNPLSDLESRTTFITDGSLEGTGPLLVQGTGGQPSTGELSSDLYPLSDGRYGAAIRTSALGTEPFVFEDDRAVLLADLQPGAQSSSAFPIGTLNHQMYFLAGLPPQPPVHPSEYSALLRTDGRTLEQFEAQPLPYETAVAARGALFSDRYDGTDYLGRTLSLEYHLLRIDIDGTIRDLATLDDQIIDSLLPAGGLLYYVLEPFVPSHLDPYNLERPKEIWVTDGTRAHQLAVQEPSDVRAVDGVLVFSAFSIEHGRELWRSDGTDAGTFAISDIAPGPMSSGASEATLLGDEILVSAFRDDVGRELFAIPRDVLDHECREEWFTCLGDGRFEVAVDWRVASTGASGRAKGTAITGKTAAFAFFNDDNVELLVKILDGRSINESFWMLYGGLSDVDYWVTVVDTKTGRTKTYYNPAGNLCGQADVDALPERELLPDEREGDAIIQRRSAPFDRSGLLDAATTPCAPGPYTLCLANDRFKVEVEHTLGGTTQSSHPISGTSESGYFWFFGPDNLELVVKVLDGRTTNGHFWVFFGALSDVEYTLTVTDTVEGKRRVYHNRKASQCGLPDTSAF